MLRSEKVSSVGSLSIILVGDREIQALNRQYLHKNSPTDVLAFPLDESGVLSGEVYVSTEQAELQAKQYRVSFENELSRLVVHGVLHLVGYDDRKSNARKRIREREGHYLKNFCLVRMKTKT